MFTPITGKTLDNLRRATNRPDAAMEMADLRFYDRGYLVRITEDDGVDYFVAAWKEGGGIVWFPLDGSSQPIHDANRFARLNLTENNVLDYLRFFCDFLDMKEGRMRITGTGHVMVSSYKLVPTMAPVVCGYSEGAHICEGHALYANSVFRATFSVPPDGKVVMLNDEEIEALTVH